MYYVYILQSKKDKTFYIGYTKNIEDRLKRHNAGRSIYTRRDMPWILIHTEKFSERKDAFRRESEIKSYKGGVQFKSLINRGEVA